ncbi:ribbon-helix-helix domain-containing protein [Deinococcus sp. VB343]|uniref:Ribbon-helix-helix domain-containing protein n=1 Tax=Deinococcus sp. VB142 TaxID=3112952 RepID=A0AAU6Q724_9DEIO
MTYQTAQRYTVTLSPELATYLDRYQAETKVSRSEALAHAVRALQEQQLAQQYAEYARSGEFVDLESGDGLDPDEGVWWE